MNNRREHRIGTREASKQIRSLSAISRTAIGPDLLDARDVRLRVLGEFFRSHRPMDIHVAFVAQCHEAGMHLGRNGACMCARRTIGRPQLRIGKPLCQILDNGQRIPDRDVAIDERRHFSRLCNVENALLIGAVCIKRNDDLTERNVRAFQRHPWPHRPRRIILVADDESQSHCLALAAVSLSNPVFACQSRMAPAIQATMPGHRRCRPKPAVATSHPRYDRKHES